jgi:hypothetical protein
LSSALHFVIYISSTGNDRRVASVREVVDCDGANIISNEIFALNSQGELLRTFPLREATRELLSTFGYDDERCLP